MNDNIRRLIYGTYKLPHEYEEFSDMLSLCVEHGIKCIDTAPIYNKRLSELWIGKWNESNRGGLNVSTKAGKFYADSGRLVVSNNCDDILHSIKTSLQRLKQNKLDVLFIHDYENGRSSREISDLIQRLFSKHLIKRIGLSNFPPEIIENLEIKNEIAYLQVDSNSENLREQISFCESMGIQVWIYRPFNQGKVITKQGRNPEEVILDLLEAFPTCNFVFGASKLEQLAWLEKV